MGIRQRRMTPTVRQSFPNSRGQRWDSPGMFCFSKQMLAFVHVDISFFSELFQRIQHFRSAQKFLDIVACLERMPWFSLCQDLGWTKELPRSCSWSREWIRGPSLNCDLGPKCLGEQFATCLRLAQNQDPQVPQDSKLGWEKGPEIMLYKICGENINNTVIWGNSIILTPPR